MAFALHPISNVEPRNAYNQWRTLSKFLLLERSLPWQCGSLIQEEKLGKEWLAQDYKMKIWRRHEIKSWLHWKRGRKDRYKRHFWVIYLGSTTLKCFLLYIFMAQTEMTKHKHQWGEQLNIYNSRQWRHDVF